MRLSAIASLAGLLSTSVYAAPHGNDTIIEPHVLDVLAGKNIKTTLDPQYDLKCPKTSNYEEHTYTRGQLKAAFLTASKLDANAKQIGDSTYCSLHLLIRRVEAEIKGFIGQRLRDFPVSAC
jgi:hypothetical protein